MREIIYRFCTRGCYETADNTVFRDDFRVKIIVEPHDVSVTVSGDLLRKTSCKGYQIEATQKGEVIFRDMEGKELCRCEEQEQAYREIRLLWKQGELSLQFGATEFIDHYPNCDGEYDRWDERWHGKYQVTLDEESNKVSCSVL